MREQLLEYYAPKNFNVWYFFGSLALVALVMQLFTGIFLTMFYKVGADSRVRLGRIHHARGRLRVVDSLPAFHRGIGVLLSRLPAHVPRAPVRLVQGAARTAVAVRHVHLPGADGRGLHGLRAALGQHVLLGRAGDHQPVQHHPGDWTRAGGMDPRRLWRGGCDRGSLLRTARGGDPAGAAAPGRAAPGRAARGGLQ